MILLLRTADTNKSFGLYLSSVLNGGAEINDKLAKLRKKTVHCRDIWERDIYCFSLRITLNN
jgi:hypothetical protein